MTSFVIHQVATFTDAPFSGNPAYVLVSSQSEPTATLDAIRRQMREDVLAVLMPTEDGLAVDFVTAFGPHPGPGHATHAAAWVAMNRLGPKTDKVELRVTAGGTRRAWRDGELIAIDWPAMAWSPSDDSSALERVLGSRPVETHHSAFGVVAVMDDEAAVRTMNPDLQAMARMEADTLIVTARSEAADFVVRVFAPKLGLPEDPVCGTAHRILAPYWADRIGRRSLVSHQLSPRGGELFCHVGEDAVTIAGRAVPFLEGRIET